MRSIISICLILLAFVIIEVSAHGRMTVPTARFGPTPPASTFALTDPNSPCGNAQFDTPSTFVTSFTEGDTVTFTWNAAAHHPGPDEYAICYQDNVASNETCFSDPANILSTTDTTGLNSLPPGAPSQTFSVNVTLPLGKTCSQCTLRWRWFGDTVYKNCADINVLSNNKGKAAKAFGVIAGLFFGLVAAAGVVAVGAHYTGAVTIQKLLPYVPQRGKSDSSSFSSSSIVAKPSSTNTDSLSRSSSSTAPRRPPPPVPSKTVSQSDLSSASYSPPATAARPPTRPPPATPTSRVSSPYGGTGTASPRSTKV